MIIMRVIEHWTPLLNSFRFVQSRIQRSLPSTLLSFDACAKRKRTACPTGNGMRKQSVASQRRYGRFNLSGLATCYTPLLLRPVATSPVPVRGLLTSRAYAFLPDLPPVVPPV